MKEEMKKWIVEYDHKDGRSGKIKVITAISQGSEFQYGNGKGGCIKIGDHIWVYDLRYNKGDLHKVMLNDYFGKGIVSVIEIA